MSLGIGGVLFGALLLSAEVRVASLNVENYLVQDRQVEGQWRADYPKPEKEKSAIRRALLEIDPDILALQEMGPTPFLLELRKDLDQEGLHYPFAILGNAEDSERHLAVLSKIKPLEVISHTDMDFPYLGERLGVKRGLLEIVFPTGTGEGGTWSLFVVHLKSRWSQVASDPESSERRTKEAQAARDRILERYPNGDGLFLIAGDFNDHRRSAPLRRFTQRGAVEIARIVESYDTRGEKWTFYYDREDRYERVDFFLASRDMEKWIKGSQGWVFDPLYAREGSDHRAIYLDLQFPLQQESETPAM
ncbi:MAG: endonuclease/exonuclease/phosphatase family protein [Puniceicoccales bacterium]